MPDYVIDASAILALLQNESGADIVRACVERTSSIISAVNLAEVGYKMVERGLSGAQVQEAMIEFGVEVRPFDAEQAMILADLYVPTKRLGLSFADRACLALARLMRLPALTADRAWRDVDLDIEIELIRQYRNSGLR